MFLLMQSIVFQTGIPTTSQTDTNLPVLPTSQTQSTQPPAMQFVPSTKLQSLTVVTLGKMCLQNEQQAKKIIPAFGQILDTSNDPSIKNNIMYALTDMCVRYASLVDPLLPQMTTCLKDKALSVRRTTLILLIHLLQEDYLKIRGNGKFLFRLIQTLQDSSEEIRHLTTFYIQQRLLKRIPKIMYSHFVESLFHFNDYKEHASYNKFVVSEKERRMFNLSGERNTEKRRSLYKFMLENMNDEQRFQTTYRLCQDILGGVVEGTVSLSSASMLLLKDTFFCLASDAIKLASLKSKANEDEAETEQDMAGKVLEAAKKTIISGVVKKNVIENIIPIIIALKHKLEAAKSPLVSEVFIYLRKIMEDYKNEVNDILAADKQLAKEIEFDMRRYEKEQEELRKKEEQERLAREQRQRKANESVSNPELLNNSGARTPGSPVTGTPRTAASASRLSTVSSPNIRDGTPSGKSRARPELLKQALHNALLHSNKKGRKSTSRLMESFNAANIEHLEKVSHAENESPIVDTSKMNVANDGDSEASKNKNNASISNDNVQANVSDTEVNRGASKEKENTDSKVEKNSTNQLLGEGNLVPSTENEKVIPVSENPGSVSDQPIVQVNNNLDKENEAPVSADLKESSENCQEVEAEPSQDGEENAKDLNKSKRVSGQGMERQTQC